MKKIIVLAGNFYEFQNYIRFQIEPISRFVYGDFPHKIDGIEASRVDIVGTFYNRSDAGKLEELAKSRIRK